MTSKTFLSAHWKYLAMFNYEVDPEILKPHLPPYTELDLFNGKAIVSVVGFLFNNTKVMGIKWPASFVHDIAFYQLFGKMLSHRQINYFI